MPRDASETRTKLLEQAEHLFAVRGVHQATAREIVAAAGQRNASALTYHFGSREGVLVAILRRHGDLLDRDRGLLVREPIEAMSTRDLLAALLVPLAGRLGTRTGRDYLRIVAQLTGQFPAWRLGTPLSPPHLRRILATLEERAGGSDPARRRDRVVHAITLMTSAMAERARAVEEHLPLELDEGAFLANLADIIVGGLEAPSGALLGVPAPA